MNESERFFEKVDATGDCWVWTAGKLRKGYGGFRVRVCAGKWITARAHCWAYEFFRGPISKGEHVRHCCDNPACVNPEHLLLGTNTDNMHDMLERGGHVAQKRSGIRDQWRPNHCYAGHAYTPENTYLHPNGFRVCRACKRATDHGYFARRKERDGAYWRK